MLGFFFLFSSEAFIKEHLHSFASARSEQISCSTWAWSLCVRNQAVVWDCSRVQHTLSSSGALPWPYCSPGERGSEIESEAESFY